MHLYTKYQMSISIGSNVMANVKVDDLIFFPLTLKNDPDIDILLLKICGSKKHTFWPTIKSLSVIAQKLWPLLKLYGQNSIFDL